MRTLLTGLAGLAAWLVISLGIGTVVGRGIRLADEALAELDQADHATDRASGSSRADATRPWQAGRAVD